MRQAGTVPYSLSIPVAVMRVPRVSGSVQTHNPVAIAKNAKIIKADPSSDAFTTAIVTEALKGITGDTLGKDFKPGTVPVTPGGN